MHGCMRLRGCCMRLRSCIYIAAMCVRSSCALHAQQLRVLRCRPMPFVICSSMLPAASRICKTTPQPPTPCYPRAACYVWSTCQSSWTLWQL